MEPITAQFAEKVYLHSKKAFSLFTLTLLLFTSFYILNQNAEAQQLVCPQRAIIQITNDPNEDSFQPDITLDGNLVAFSSRSNINGGNPDNNNEIYLYNTMTGVFVQITDIPGTSSLPSINADGTRIAFRTTANINGGNPDGNREIYLFDTVTGTFTQITNTTAGSSGGASINADGTRISFFSSADINGGNPDGNSEIYLFDTTTGIITQVTDTTAGDSFDSSINADGTRIAFDSSSNINGGNPDSNEEVYLFDTTNGTTTQITSDPTRDSADPSINVDGTKIALISQADINGGNPFGVRQIYVFDTTTGIFTQVTSIAGGVIQALSLNADGSIVAFRSSADINGGNPDGNREIYIADVAKGISTQVTVTAGGNSGRPSITADGTQLAFESDADINGGNPDGNDEIYFTTCLDPAVARNIPTLSEWGLIAMAGVLGIVGFMVIKRRQVTT